MSFSTVAMYSTVGCNVDDACQKEEITLTVISEGLYFSSMSMFNAASISSWVSA